MAKKQNGGGADDILLNINVTGRESLAGARNDAKGLNEELKNGGKVDLGSGVKSLKQQLRDATLEAQKLFAAGKENTDEYKNAAKKVAGLKDNIQELNRTFEAFNPDNKFKVFSQLASAGAKAVQGYAGAMAFLGVNSEDAAQTIAKLQGIMAFADAIDSLGDLKDSYNDLLRMLGLTSAATKVQTTEAAVQTEAAVAGSTAVIAAEERVAIARVAAADASIAADVALQAKRAQTTTSTIGLTTAEEANFAAKQALAIATTELAAAEQALAIATGNATVSTAGQGAALAGVTVAEEGATVASYGLGAALKAIGIGLIIGLIAYLVTNFQAVKKAVVDLFPGLGTAGEKFDKLKQIVFGVGNAVLQFIIAPIKAIIKLVQGEFSAALDELKKGADFAGNFQKGASAEAAAQAEERRKERVKKEIEANDRIIKERKALGQSTLALEVANKKREISILDKEDEDYNKNKADLMTDITVMQNAEYKKQSDAYAAKLKEDLDKIKTFRDENLKVVRESGISERKIALNDIDIKFRAELELLNKRKSANKNYNTDLKNLTKARKVEEAKINKQYDDAITAYQLESVATYQTKYEEAEAAIRKKADELRKNATAAQLNAIGAIEARLLGQNNAESIASAASTDANTNLTNVENINRPSDTDTPDEARAKIEALATARREAENAAFELKKTQLQGEHGELEALNAEHEKNLTDINLENANAREEIAKIEAENRLKLFDAIGAGASTASELLGESTLAGKALAIASATISTYSAIAGQLQAFSKVPVPGYAIAQAIATGLVGIANVKKILSVKVPSKSGGGSSGGSGSAPTAPVINSTVLNQDKSGSNDVTKAIGQQQAQQKPLKAYITNKDLADQKDRADYYNAQSTY